jgi:outer membrane receptor protein involved in Fe transport
MSPAIAQCSRIAPSLRRAALLLAVLAHLSWAPTTANAQSPSHGSIADDVLINPLEPALDFDAIWQNDGQAVPAQFQQQATPRVEAPSTPSATPASQQASQQFWTSFGVSQTPSFAATTPAIVGNAVSGEESAIRASTDLGGLLGDTPSVVNLGVQHRNPIVNDPRVRGSQVGSLAAAGSYWVPARIDLDTMVSKIDSRLVENTIVIPGPYSALYGPGKQFVDIELKRAPRYNQGFQAFASTSVDYRTNGDPWYGRQSLWGGDDVWGFRVGYGHRTGNDYESGDGLLIPASYKSRDIDLAVGAQLTPHVAVDAMALRLDQTDVELAGQAFDLDFLVTDGYEVTLAWDNPSWADSVTLDSWYNNTRFDGSAQRASKRKQFPVYDLLAFEGFTNVDSTSTGYRLISHWGGDEERLDAGADLRYIKQELNEITSGVDQFQWIDQNSPIPKSDSVNPGLFVEASSPVADQTALTAGARLDYNGTHVLEDNSQLAALGINSELVPTSAADIWGSGDLLQNDILGLAYLSADMELGEGWGVGARVGYSERAPNLTERYAVETFMFLLQNGLNTVTGDPELDKERLIQTDLSFWQRAGDFTGQVVVYHAWVRDYVTYEALQAVPFPPGGQIEQVNLKFVNTDLATLWGAEARGEYELSDSLTPFATLRYVEGEDRTRNGSFDTVPSGPGIPSVRDPNAVRGTGSGVGVALADEEPLPGILPLESRIGLRWEEPRDRARWGVEISARLVDNQDRIAASLLERATPGFTVYDLRVFLRPTEQLQLVGGVENFTDKHYQEHLDYHPANPAALATFRPGVNFYFGSELQY